MCCKALHERHPGRGNSKAKLALVAFGERERGGVGVGLEHLDLPAARVLIRSRGYLELSGSLIQGAFERV
jgi:hypothetical protein